MCMVFAKINIICNSSLKKIGVFLFLRHASSNHLNKKYQEFGKSKYIDFSMLYDGLKFDADKNYYIVSASFEDYIKPIFPLSVKVIGSKLMLDDKNLTVLKSNCFGQTKLDEFLKQGIDNIDEFFTDSFDDLPLARISKKITIVDGDNMFSCKNIDEFKDFFRK